MADEQNLNADELEKLPTIGGDEGEHDAPDEPVDLDVETDEEQDLEQPDEDSENDDAEEFDVIELDGKEYQVPKALKAGFMKNADYTRKTQETAELRKALEAREAELKQQADVSEEEIKERAKLVGIEDRISQYEKVDWDALERQDPMGAQTHWRTFQQLQQQRQAAQQSLSQRQQERTQKSQQDLAKRIEETRTYAQTQIRGWTPEVDAKVQEFIVEKGIPQHFVAENLSPVFYDILYKAWLGEQSIKKQSAAGKKPAAPSNLKPTQTIASRAAPGARKSLSEMSVEEYVAHRNAQERKQARR